MGPAAVGEIRGVVTEGDPGHERPVSGAVVFCGPDRGMYLRHSSPGGSLIREGPFCGFLGWTPADANGAFAAVVPSGAARSWRVRVVQFLDVVTWEPVMGKPLHRWRKAMNLGLRLFGRVPYSTESILCDFWISASDFGRGPVALHVSRWDERGDVRPVVLSPRHCLSPLGALGPSGGSPFA